MPSDELVTARELSSRIAGNQGYAIGAGVLALLLLLAIAYLAPVIRAPRWQVVAVLLLPLSVAFSTLAVLSRPLEQKVHRIAYEDMQKVIDSELAPPDDKALADRILKWQGELHGRSFLIDIASMPLSTTFAASAALVCLLWFTSHYRTLRAD